MMGSPTINYINFNQNGSCISIATTDGFRIYNCDPFGKFYSQKKLNYNAFSSQTSNNLSSAENNSSNSLTPVISPIGYSYAIIEMLFSTSLLAIVGLGEQPALSPRRLTMLNTKTDTIICEVTFPTAILAVRMNKAKLVVVLKEQIYIYDINNMRLLHTIENNSNDKGLVALSTSNEKCFLAYPSPPKIINSDIESNLTTNNMVLLSNNNTTTNTNNNRNALESTNDDRENHNENMNNENIFGSENTYSNNISSSSKNSHKIIKNGDVILFDLTTLQPTMVIEAHKGTIAALALNNAGTLLATASEKGTIIRVFSVETGAKLYQFRRGTYPTNIHSITFSSDGQFLSVTCSSRTVHIFKMNIDDMIARSETITNGQNSPPPLEEMINDFDGEDTAAQDNASSIDTSDTKREPLVDTTRSTVGRMIRKSTQKISRNAAKKIGEYFPLDVKSIIESSRHFASFKLPNENKDNYSNHISSSAQQVNYQNQNNTSSESLTNLNGVNNSSSKYISCIGEGIEIDISNYPELFSSGNYMENNTSQLLKVLPIRVLSSDGSYFNYILDPERGGDCILFSKYSLLLD